MLLYRRCVCRLFAGRRLLVRGGSRCCSGSHSAFASPVSVSTFIPPLPSLFPGIHLVFDDCRSWHRSLCVPASCMACCSLVHVGIKQNERGNEVRRVFSWPLHCHRHFLRRVPCFCMSQHHELRSHMIRSGCRLNEAILGINYHN